MDNSQLYEDQSYVNNLWWILGRLGIKTSRSFYILGDPLTYEMIEKAAQAISKRGLR